MENEIFKLIREEKVSLFIGSGFSLKAGAPSANKIVDMITSMMTTEQKNSLNSKELARVSLEYEQMYGRNALLSVLKDAFTFEPTDTSDHYLLSRIPHFKRIFTTNYDTLLEDTYRNDCQVIRSTEDCPAINSRVAIFKIHGDFEKEESIVITNNDYTHLLTSSSEKGLWNLIKTEFLTKTILFIGYSLEDENIFDIVEKLNNEIGDKRNPMYLLAPGFVQHKRQRLNKLNVNYLDGTADEFLTKLREEIEHNIISDYNTHKVSHEQLTFVCKDHNLIATTIGDNVDTSPSSFKSIDGSPIVTKIDFTLKGKEEELNTLFPHGRYEFDEKIGLAVTKIPRNMLEDLKISLNGLHIRSLHDIQDIYIGSRKKIGKVNLTSNGMLIENVSYERYIIESGKECLLRIRSNVYKLNLSLVLNKDNTLSGKITTEFPSTYTSNREAIKWTKLLVNIFEGKKVTASKNGCNLSLYSKQNLDLVHQLKLHLKYYSVVKEIEDIIEADFVVNNNYSLENYNKAKIILGYLKKEQVLSDACKEIEFKTTGKDLSHYVGQRVLALSQSQFGDIELNNMNFCINWKIEIANMTILRMDYDPVKNETIIKCQPNNGKIICLYSDNPSEIKNGQMHYPFPVKFDIFKS